MSHNFDFFKILPAILNTKNSLAAIQFIEDLFFKKKTDHFVSNNDQLIYIGGYARSRSTYLLNQFYDMGIFCSLKYSHFPFITSPIISNKISNILYSDKKIDRAHNDGLQIDLNSPESFEEIFWANELDHVFDKKYLKEIKNYNEDTFQNYFNLIKKIKFISKNHNYICKSNYFFLRLDIFEKQKLNYLYFVTIRNPLAQAQSLNNQHIKFTSYGYKNNLVGKYLNSVGKYEFGSKRKPILLNNQSLNSKSLEYFNQNDNLNFYLSQWIIIYEFILNLKKKNFSKVFFIDISSESSFSSFDQFKRIRSLDYRQLIANIKNNTHITNDNNSESYMSNLDKNLVDMSLSLYERIMNYL